MIKDNKKFYRAMVLIIIMILVSIELPYSDKAIIQHVILFFSSNFTDEVSVYVTSLWAIPLLIGWIWSFSEVVKSKKIEINGLILFIAIFMIMIPITEKATNIIRASVYMLNEGINSIEVVDSSLSIMDLEHDYIALLEVDMKYHVDLNDKVKIRLILPDQIEHFFYETNFLLKQDSESYSGDIAKFRGKVNLKLKEGINREVLSQLRMKRLDYELVLILGNEERDYIRNDMY